MKKYDVILLDIDGTLMDFEKAQECAFKNLMEKHNIEYTPFTYATYDKINKELWQALECGEVNKDKLKLERFQRLLEILKIKRDISEMNKDYEKELGNGAYLIEGAETICKDLKEVCMLAIVTNGIAKTQYSRLEKSGLNSYFDKIFISEEVGTNKPDLSFFKSVFSQISNINLSRVLVVGDSLTADIKGGNLAGIDTCWFNPKQNKGLEDIVATYEITNLRQLKEIVGI